MKTYLHEEFIDESLLKEPERQELQSEYQQMLNTIEKKYALQQQRFMEQEDALYERFAREAGFSGYDSGEDSYNKHYKASLLDSKAVSQEIHDKLYDFTMRKIMSDDYSSLVKSSKQAEKDELDERKWARQVYLNRVLDRTYLRAVKYTDCYGKPIPHPRTYNRYDEETKKSLDKSVTRSYTVGKGSKAEQVAIDASISGVVTGLWDTGIRTNACCSGMVADHPFDRFDANDRFGRWKKGDLVKMHLDVKSAYLSLPFKGNNPELVRQATEKARDWGWTTDIRNVYGEESLVFYPPHTLDGATYDTILLEAGQLMDSFLKSGEASDEQEAMYMARQLAEKNHGGFVRYTDRMLAYNFRSLSDGLSDIIRNIRKEERRQNIESGKAVDLYRYDYGKDLPVLTPQQLKGVFDRADIDLDMESVNRPLDRDCTFLVHQGKARLLSLQEAEKIPWTMVNSKEWLSYLMAGQIKDTPHTGQGGETVTVMVHPDPQSAEVSAQFTVTQKMDQMDYYRFFSNEGDMKQYYSTHLTKELYQAAQHAYDNSLQKKVDDLKPQMAVSDIRIRKGMDNNLYISCKVFGEQQLSKRMNQVDVNYYNMRMRSSDKAYNGVAPELANKYYAEEIDLAKSLQQKEGQGMKR